MSATESDKPEPPPTNSGESGGRSRKSSMDPLCGLQQVGSTIEQVECELAHIDRIIQSWSDGRSLRFDPAHIQSAKKKVDEKGIHEKAGQEHTRWLLRILISLNLIAAMLVSVTTICEFGFGWIGKSLCIGVLAGTAIAATLLNVYFIKQLINKPLSNRLASPHNKA